MRHALDEVSQTLHTQPKGFDAGFAIAFSAEEAAEHGDLPDDLGVSLKTAIQHGVSSKRYWHMARTPAMQQALNNDWLGRQGVPSIKQLWCKAQGYTS